MQPIFVQQYRALGDGAGVANRSERGRIAASGADRLSFLHAMLTNDIASLRPGAGCYAAYLTPQGRMIADMRVLELGDLTLLDLEAGTKTAVLEKLEQFIFSEDVRLVDATGDIGEIGVYGARASRQRHRDLGRALEAYQRATTFFPDDYMLWAQMGDVAWEVYRKGAGNDMLDRAANANADPGFESEFANRFLVLPGSFFNHCD